MTSKRFNMDYLQLAAIAFVVWTAIMGVTYYTTLEPYSPPPVEEIRSSPLMDLMKPTIVFSCYKDDESKLGSNLECESRLLYERDITTYYMRETRLIMIIYLTIPIAFWLFFIAYPKAFTALTRRFVDE